MHSPHNPLETHSDGRETVEREIIGPNVAIVFGFYFTMTVTHITSSVWNERVHKGKVWNGSNTLHALWAVFPHSLMLGPVVQMIKHLFMHCQIFFLSLLFTQDTFVYIEQTYGLILQGCYGFKYSFVQVYLCLSLS